MALPLLGAYAMAPSDDADSARFHAALADEPIGGLELPLTAPDDPRGTRAWREQHLAPAWDLLLTCVPVVMGRLAEAPGYGLASADDAGRRAALDDVARAAEVARSVADARGRAAVLGIQVHSAPGAARGTTEPAALRRSLEEICTWDLAGARLLVEHCDAPTDGPVSKGFLTLADELAAVAGLTTRDGAAVGVSVNWGRSAIEGRSAGTPVEHLTAARDAAALGALVLSGATDVESPWGPAWSDAHIPPRGAAPALEASSASLLGADEITAAVRAAGDVTVALKIYVRPRDADVEHRLAVARAGIDLVTSATRDGA